MRPIGLFVMCLLLAACTTPPMFPPEFTRNIKTDPVALKAWKEQTSYPSGVNFISRKVQLGGQIIQVVRKPDGVIIVAEEQPINKYLGYGPTSVSRPGSFKFAIVLHGFPDAGTLQAGNQLAVVGATVGSSPEAIGSMPKILPYLLAHCLYIWKTQGFEADNFPYEGSMGYYQLEKRTFCQEEGKGDNLSTGGGQGDQERSSGS